MQLIFSYWWNLWCARYILPRTATNLGIMKEISLCTYKSLPSVWLVQLSGIHERKGWKEHNIYAMDLGGPGESNYRLQQKTEIRSITMLAQRANESHNCSSRYHNADGKFVCKPVDDISQISQVRDYTLPFEDGARPMFHT